MDTLVKKLIESTVLATPHIIDAFRAIDRKNFVPALYKNRSYEDGPLPIGFDQTISQPTTVAFMLELLGPKPGHKILDVGSGSGWTTALLAQVAGKTGEVWGVERIPELVVFGARNLGKYHFPHAHILRAGPELGLPDRAPFDRILVSASAPKLPHGLIEQCRTGGRIVIPVGTELWKIDKISDTNIATERYPLFAFVPLITDEK